MIEGSDDLQIWTEVTQVLEVIATDTEVRFLRVPLSQNYFRIRLTQSS